MARKKNNNKESVVIYALYNDVDNSVENFSELLSLGCQREDELKKYCKEKGYEVIEIFRNSKTDYLPYKLKCLLEVIYKYQTIHCPNNYISKINKIIIYDIYDICSNISEFNVIFDMLNREYIKLETIKQGVVSADTFNELEVISNEK